MAQFIGVNNSVGTGGDGSWHLTKHAFQNPKSVVQTILNRQLGLPYCSGNGGISERVIGRQLLNSRAVSEVNGKSVNAAQMDLKPEKNPQLLDKRITVPLWIRIDVGGNFDVAITDTTLWVQRYINTSRGIVCSERFYAVEPYPYSGLTCIKKIHSSATGMPMRVFIIANRRLSNGRNSTYLLTLREPGFLRAFDLVSHEIADELHLPINVSQQSEIKYSEMDIMGNSNKICVYGMNERLTKVIIVLSFPPWKQSRIIHVEIPFKISICDGVCFLQQEKVLHITTWPLLLQKITAVPNVKFEGKLTELPTTLSTVNLQTDIYGVIEMRIPLFFKNANTGINFFEFNNDANPVYKFLSGAMDAHKTIKVLPFPDDTSKVLLCTHFSGQSQIVEFKTEWNDRANQKVSTATTLDVFNYWEKSRIAAQASIAATDVDSPKISILGITYCSLMDYIAVLSADDKEFQVVIYDPLKFNAVKALPPVLAWPGIVGESGAMSKKRESIVNVHIRFEPELMYVSVLYKEKCKPEKEVFFVRLLSEKS